MSWSGYREDDGAPTVNMVNSEVRRAKYPHKCALCGQAIQPGQDYKRDVWTEDGELRVMKSHYHGCAWEAHLGDEPEPLEDIDEPSMDPMFMP